ncbi:EamA/RhaT family transporter, partial [Cribrihabitans sp. XS_ASV171]
MSPNLTGSLLMMASMAAFTINDTIVKLLGEAMPLFQIITLRGALTCLWLFLLARHMGALHLNFPARDRWLVLARCGTEVAATFFFLTALLNMP